MTKLVVIDGNSIIHRAFHATPPLKNKQGEYTNAVFGFTNILLKILKDENPTHVFVAFDVGKKTFRHEQYAEYKGTRASTAPELKPQFPLVRELVSALNIEQLGIEGYEADDIIGTVTKWADANNIPTVAVTGDKDYLQLVSDNTTVVLMKRGVSETETYDPAKVFEKYTLTPLQIIDLKGLMGDTSDNIPGVPGVGEKTAIKLLSQFESVEGVLSNTDQLKGKLKENLESHKEDATLSKELATIYRDVPMEISLDAYARKSPDEDVVVELFKRLEFKVLLNKLGFTSTGSSATPKISTNFSVVNSYNLPYFISKLSEVSAIHVESLGENPHRAELLGIGFHTPNQNFFMPASVLKSDELDLTSVVQYLEDSARLKYVHDLNRTLVVLSHAGITLRGTKVDTLLAAYLIQSTGATNDIRYLANTYLDLGIESDEDVYGKGAKIKIPSIEVLAEHVCKKVTTIAHVVGDLESRLKELSMTELFFDLEMPLAEVLSDLELQGMAIDKESLEEYGKELVDRISNLETDIHTLAGRKFKITSPLELGKVLFTDLELPVVKKTKTGFSTDVDVLETLAPLHPIISKISEHRQLTKQHSMFVEGVLKELHADGKVHTYYNQALVSTGRLSSQFPNMQNIPARTAEGRRVKKVFIPSREGFDILAADYSQVELRVLAHISGDSRMREAFLNDMDIHTKTAMDVFGVSEQEVTSEMRRRAKAVNFGIVYGISDFGLSQNLGIARKEAAEFIDTYLRTFEGVKAYMEDSVKKAKEDGSVATLLNRRRELPDINTSNFSARAAAERIAMNTPIQGTAADIIKVAMINLQKEMKKRDLKSKMLLQVHDELVFEVSHDELDLMKGLVKEYMESAFKLSVPLKVDIDHGKSWYEAK